MNIQDILTFSCSSAAFSRLIFCNSAISAAVSSSSSESESESSASLSSSGSSASKFCSTFSLLVGFSSISSLALSTRRPRPRSRCFSMEATRSRSSSSRRKSRPKFSSGAPWPRSRYFSDVCEGLKKNGNFPSNF